MKRNCLIGSIRSVRTHCQLLLPKSILRNQQRVEVRVNDRGPFIANRIVDLSYAAAEALGVSQDGVARVRVQALQ